MDKRTVSVVICTHDVARFDRLRQAVDSVRAQSEPAKQVLLVIDGDQALRDQAEAQFPDVCVLANARTKGLSGARNTGVLVATGDVVAFIDDDAVASPDWLKCLNASFHRQDVYGAGGPIVAFWPKGRPSWLPNEFDWVVGCSFAGQTTRRGAIRNLIGCNMAFRRNVLMMAGLFDEGLGRVGTNAAGAEETEFCIRAGHMFPMSILAHADSASVLHQIDAHRASLRYFMKRCFAEGRSKARMAQLSPSVSNLSSERQQLFSVLPRSLATYVANHFSGKDQNGMARAGATLLGTALVVGSFVMARLRRHPGIAVAKSFAPLKVCDIDLASPGLIAGRNAETGVGYAAAHCVVRCHGNIVGVLQIPLYGEDLSADAVAGQLSHLTPLSSEAAPIAAAAVRVVVATRNRAEMLERCLDSLLVQDHPDYSIVVVDNAPSDTITRELITQKYAPTGRVHYRLEPQPGLANAHNRGLAGLDLEIVAFTDDDVVADQQWLSRLTAPFAEDGAIGCVTGGIVPAELETRAQWWTERHGAFLKGLERRDYNMDVHRPHDKLFPFAAGQLGSGANMAFRRSALDTIGGRFDPALGAGTLARGGDDLAAFADIVLAGHRLVYLPHALVWHYHRRSEDGMKRQAYGYGVGLGAYLTKCIVDRPTRVFTFMIALPEALLHLLGKSSQKNKRVADDYPSSFVWSERLGIICGIPAYFWSRRAHHRLTTGNGKRPVTTDAIWKGQ